MFMFQSRTIKGYDQIAMVAYMLQSQESPLLIKESRCMTISIESMHSILLQFEVEETESSRYFFSLNIDYSFTAST